MDIGKGIIKGLEEAVEYEKTAAPTQLIYNKENILKGSLKYVWTSKMSFRYKIKESLYQIKNAIARAKYGYCDEDWFEYFYNYCDRNIKLFSEFRDRGCSSLWKLPPRETIGTEEDKLIPMTSEEQKEFFNLLIKYLHYMKDENYLSREMYGKDYHKLTNQERLCVIDNMEFAKNNYFDIMKDYFFDLWD